MLNGVLQQGHLNSLPYKKSPKDILSIFFNSSFTLLVIKSLSSFKLQYQFPGKCSMAELVIQELKREGGVVLANYFLLFSRPIFCGVGDWKGD